MRSAPERAAALVDAGVFLQLAGDLEGARDLFRRAMTLDPQNTRAQRLFASTGGVVPAPAPAPVSPEFAPTLVRGPAPVPAPAAMVEPLNVRVARPIGRPPVPEPIWTPVSTPNPVPDPSTLQTLTHPMLRPDARSAEVEGHLREADELLRVGTYDEALECVMRVLRPDPENLAAHEKAYDILRASGNLSAALDQLVNVLRLLMRRGDVDRASACLQTLRRERPERPELAGFLALLGDPGETVVLSEEHFKPVRDGANTLVLPVIRSGKKP